MSREPMFGECSKHPGNSMLGCSLCSIQEAVEKRTTIESLQRERDALKAENERLVEALEKAERILDSISDMVPGRFSTEACADTARTMRDELRAALASRSPSKPTEQAIDSSSKSMEEMLIEATDEQAMLRARLQSIKEIIDGIENRCMAADGPVTNTRHEMTDEELRRIYRLAGGSTP